jgi:hypothetical protein
MPPANMKSHSPEALLTPAIVGIVSAMGRAKRPPFYSLTPMQARLAYEAGAGVLELPARAMAQVKDFSLLARDADMPLALQLLIYPGCAAQQETLSHRAYTHGFVLDEPSIIWFFNQYMQTLPAHCDRLSKKPTNPH